MGPTANRLYMACGDDNVIDLAFVYYAIPIVDVMLVMMMMLGKMITFSDYGNFPNRCCYKFNGHNDSDIGNKRSEPRCG